MATTTLSELPPALALTGSELLFISQRSPEPTPWISYSVTLDQISDYFQGIDITGSATIRQLAAAMAFQGVLVSVLDALPSDVTNSYNIAWYHAGQMVISDPFVTGFLQPTLGYSGAQMTALYALALSYPA